MRIHLVATPVVVAMMVAFSVTAEDAAILVICILIVLSLEGINTAIEGVCDFIEELHTLDRPNKRIQVIKDVAAGAVLLAAMGAAVCGWMVLSPYF